MDNEERFKEISKAAGTLCNSMMEVINLTNDNKISFIANEVIYTAGYIQGLCGQLFEENGVIKENE